MKKKKFFLFIIFSLLAFPAFVIITFGLNNEKAPQQDDDLENVENLIIIGGIEYPDNEDMKGRIIFQESFDETLERSRIIKNKFEKQKKNNSNRTDNKKYKENFVKQLKKKDKAWHYTEHKIERGENLWAIAEKYDTDHRMIINANRINDPDFLRPGKLLSVPNRKGVFYKILKNDTLTDISKTYGIDVNRIASHNNLKKDIIYEGRSIFIPDAEKQIIKEKTSEKYTNNSAKNDNTFSIKNTNTDRPDFIWPLKGNITSAFGQRIDPISNKNKFHCGLDISAEVGTPVKASADGKTIFSGWKKGYGRAVILKHRNGYITVYAHNKENKVKEGDMVSKGDVIALSGMSGAVTGAHLHFEIRKYVTPLNPQRFIN